MCLIITIVMLFLAIQNLISNFWLAGSIQLLIALVFLFLLIRNIRLTHCERNGGCDNFCMLPEWLIEVFKRRDK